MATRPDSRQVVLRSTQGMLGTSANDTLDTIFPKINDEIAKLFEDRNAMLQNGGLITFTGTQIDFTESLELAINSKIAGGAPTVISLGSTSRTLSANGRMVYAVVDRSLGTATVTADATSLPAVTSSDQEVFLIAKRVDTSEGIQRLYWRNGMGQNAGQTLRLGASGTGSGSGLGDDLITTQFQASFTDEFAESATMSSSAVDSTKTNATYSAAKSLYQVSYDATQTVSTSGPNATMSSAPSFTVVAGDMLVSGGVAKRIATVTTQTSYVLESAFSSNLSSAACLVSQAVHTKDIYNTAFDGSAISSAFSTSFSEILVDYEDTSTVGDDIFDIGVAPVVGFVASNDNSSWSTVQVRPTLPLTQVSTLNLPTSGSALYIRLFANKSSGSGTVNVLKYKAYMQKTPSYSSGGVLNSALAFTNSVGTPINCSVGLSAGKTAITLTWTYPVGINPSTSNGALEVYLNGQKIPRYVDSVLTPDASYTEVSPTVILLDQNYSALNLSVEVVLPAVYIDQSSQNSTNISNLSEINKIGSQAFVNNVSSVLSATSSTPSSGQFWSTISNRASIVDLSNDLKVSMGNDRVAVQQIYQLQNEFGPNGELVWAAANDDRGLIRFVGGTWRNVNDSSGFRPATQSSTSDYVEITFYGTGLNLLTFLYSTTMDWRVTIDNGTESATNIVAGSNSAILGTRNYSVNQVLTVASNLTLGVHTVKIRQASASSSDISVNGFEVLNSQTTLKVNSGTSYSNGKKLTLTTQQSPAYNSVFESGTLGTRGGRVLVYQKSDGTVAKSVIPTNSSSATLASADHTNEEIARTYHFREFAAARSDDFSTIGGSNSNRAFTLEDGTTTLYGSVALNTYTNKEEALYFSGLGTGYITLTFVGTGLDIVAWAGSLTSGTGTVDNVQIFVDGVSAGTISSASATPSKIKIVSGLPYGTHTVRIAETSTSGTYDFACSKFIVYQPKKPILPENCVELADYNVMANYVANTVQSADYLSTGVLRKSGSREFTYVGTWPTFVIAPGSCGGWQAGTATNGSYVQYTFFGTGFVWRGQPAGAVATAQVTLDGSTNFTVANTSPTGGVGWSSVPTISYYGTGIVASPSGFTASTGTINFTAVSSDNNGLEISGLSLGWHTVKITKTSGTPTIYTDCLDIITPIHSYQRTIPFNKQNALPVGSQAISDNRIFSPVKDITTKKKNIAQAIGIATSGSTTSTSDVPVPDMSVTIKTGDSLLRISYSICISSNGSTGFNMYLDGVKLEPLLYSQSSSSQTSVSSSGVVPVSAGVHKIDLRWGVGSGTTTNLYFNERSLTVEEI